MFLNQGTSQPEASQQEENGDMASSELEELVELDEVQLATVVGGLDYKRWKKNWEDFLNSLQQTREETWISSSQSSNSRPPNRP